MLDTRSLHIPSLITILSRVAGSDILGFKLYDDDVNTDNAFYMSYGGTAQAKGLRQDRIVNTPARRSIGVGVGDGMGSPH